MIFFGQLVPCWTNLRTFKTVEIQAFLDYFLMTRELLYDNWDWMDKAASPATFVVQYQRVLLELPAP